MVGGIVALAAGGLFLIYGGGAPADEGDAPDGVASRVYGEGETGSPVAGARITVHKPPT